MTRDLAAVALAAGAGVRLRPLTDLRPKALCPVGNVPLVDLALAGVAPYASGVAVNACHLAGQLVDHLEGRVRLSVEPVALGTAGALGALRDWLDGRDVLVHNADAYLPGGLAALIDGWDGSRCRLLVSRQPGRGDFGDLRYVGACLLPGAVAAALPAEPAGLYERLWRDATDLELVETADVTIDCGTPADYLRANLHASGGAPVIGEGAVVDGEVIRSVVWPGGRVLAGERLVECIRAGADVTVPAGWD